LKQPLKKEKWNKLIKERISKEWIKKITLTIPLYHGLRYLNYQDFWPGKIHPILKIKSNSTRELTRIPVKIKMLTGTYILQPLRCRIYKEENSEICLSCGEEIETLEHLVLECSAWDYIRNPTLEEIKTVLYEDSSLRWDDLSPELKMQIIMDITNIQKTLNIKNESVNPIEYQTRRLLYLIHGARYRLIVKKQQK